ncbi:hypothetical protein [Rufibacter hautae]|uniref:DUF2007 domain-containing protein n=1 Tax=Rufibacter hautae TaxID=2595005 RepID=A0A5B6TGC4_9BACT|nr:hypothetical protein [Rufibacter hautae]KAA3438294.1 hypothetical protein FOA19_13645 [Rufibacter hautae]
MSERLVPAAKYLTYTEAIGLYNALTQVGVVAMVKTCGPPSLPFGDGLYYQLQLQKKDLAAAQPVLEEFSQKQAQISEEAQTCPHCGSVYVWPERDLAWWKKLVYAGTTVYKCQNCSHSFFS